jgi:hypothetical protein
MDGLILSSSDSLLWKSQQYSTNEQNTFPLFPRVERSICSQQELIGAHGKNT